MTEEEKLKLEVELQRIKQRQAEIELEKAKLDLEKSKASKPATTTAVVHSVRTYVPRQRTWEEWAFDDGFDLF